MTHKQAIAASGRASGFAPVFSAISLVVAGWMAVAGPALAEPSPPEATATYRNPVLHADYSDPDVIRVGDRYYLVSSSFHFSPGIPVLESEDLVHWRTVGHVLADLPFAPEYDLPGPFALTDAISRPTQGTRYAGGVWAPSIRFHDGRFFVYWATPDEGVFMASSADPAGPWSAPVQVIASARLEDPCPFWDDDGQAWLVHSRVGAGPLILHRMSSDGTRVLDEGRVIVEDPVSLPILEGPKLYKRNGWYYIFAPIGGVSTGPQAVGRSRAIDGPYEWRVVLEPGNGLAGPHQGGWVETPGGQGWFLHFNSTGAFGRIVHMQPVSWTDDWPIIGEPQASGTSGLPLLDRAAPDVGDVRAPELQASDEFDGPALGLQWAWNHNPDNARWSLTERSGFLRLRAGHAEHLVTARNTLTQMLVGPRRRHEVRLNVSAMVNGQKAGLSLFGVRPSWIGVVQADGARRVTLASAGVETAGPVVDGDTVILRADVEESQQVRYAFSLDDGRTFQPLGDAIDLAQFSWWKGSRPAVFTYATGAGEEADGGWVDVDWFHATAEFPLQP